MTASDKIITKLRERRQIEAELRRMATAFSEPEFRRRAEEIASWGSQVIPAIIGCLDQADERLLRAMGTVATFLDHEEVAAALNHAARQRQRTGQGRMSALTILSRYLGEPVDDRLLSGLVDEEAMALSSLEQVVVDAETRPSVLVEFVQQLDQQEPDTVLAIIRALRIQGDTRAVEPLRMIGQDVRDEIAVNALQALGGLRLPQAASALQTLTPTCAPPLRPVAERLLRKLRFAGVSVQALPAPRSEWRALISPVDGLGRQSLWFVLEAEGGNYARFLNILLSDQAGAVEAVGHDQIPTLVLPPHGRPGTVHDIELPGKGGIMLMLEATFDLGRRLLADALAQNRETQIPLAAMLRLLSPWLWGVSVPDALPAAVLPEIGGGDSTLLSQSERLLAHPAFATWHAHSEAMLQMASEAGGLPGPAMEAWVRRLAGELFVGPVVAQVFGQRLNTMSEWLLLAGEDTLSRVARAAARTLLTTRPEQHPFVLALVRRDLHLAMRLQDS